MSSNDSDHEQESLAIVRERERQKTRRYMMFLGFFAIIAISGIVVVMKDSGDGGKRKVDIDLSKGKLSFSVEKPIVEQVNQPTAEYKVGDREVEYTTGDLNPELFQQIETALPNGSPNGFVGKNFINRDVGFVLTVNNPGLWQVTYNPGGLSNPVIPINSLMTADGSHLNINRDHSMGMDLNTYVNMSLQQLMNLGMLAEYPQVSYDYATGTAFLYFSNPYNNGASYMKIVMKGNVVYIATANYNLSLSDPTAVNDLVNMVASFTLVGE